MNMIITLHSTYPASVLVTYDQQMRAGSLGYCSSCRGKQYFDRGNVRFRLQPIVRAVSLIYNVANCEVDLYHICIYLAKKELV